MTYFNYFFCLIAKQFKSQFIIDESIYNIIKISDISNIFTINLIYQIQDTYNEIYFKCNFCPINQGFILVYVVYYKKLLLLAIYFHTLNVCLQINRKKSEKWIDYIFLPFFYWKKWMRLLIFNYFILIKIEWKIICQFCMIELI